MSIASFGYPGRVATFGYGGVVVSAPPPAPDVKVSFIISSIHKELYSQTISHKELLTQTISHRDSE